MARRPALVSCVLSPVLVTLLWITPGAYGAAEQAAVVSPFDATSSWEDVRWAPRPGKYLLMYCAFGRLSNQVSCMKKTLQLAALLNRTLLVPPRGIITFRGSLVETWATSTVVDWERMARCLTPAYGPRTVMTLHEYLRKENKSKVVLKAARCIATGRPGNCVEPKYYIWFLDAVGPTLELPDIATWPDFLVPSGLPTGVLTNEQIAAAYHDVEDDVLWVGEAFGILYQRSTSHFKYKRSEECNNLWRPHAAITNFVDEIVRGHWGGGRFAAMHLRRGDFYFESIDAKRKNKTWSGYAHYSSIAEVADGVKMHLAAANITGLYVATDASRVEQRLFKNLLQGSLNLQTVISLTDFLESPKWHSRQRWARSIAGLARDSSMPWILADKMACVRSHVFLATKSSSFSADIIDMRCTERLHLKEGYSTLMCAEGTCVPHPC